VFPARYNYSCTKGLVDNCEKQLYFGFFVVFSYFCPTQVLANLDLLYISTSFSILKIFILGYFTHKIDVLGVLHTEFPMLAS
jgi:hypothetical protein